MCLSYQTFQRKLYASLNYINRSEEYAYKPYLNAIYSTKEFHLKKAYSFVMAYFRFFSFSKRMYNYIVTF